MRRINWKIFLKYLSNYIFVAFHYPSSEDSFDAASETFCGSSKQNNSAYLETRSHTSPFRVYLFPVLHKAPGQQDISTNLFKSSSPAPRSSIGRATGPSRLAEKELACILLRTS